jgi:hypothetical protein
MHVRDLDPATIKSVLLDGRLLNYHGDARWFCVVYSTRTIELQPNGDYVGERLHIHMQPRQDPVATGMSVSSSAAF